MNTLSGRKHVRGFFSGIRKGIQPTMFGRAAAIIYDEGRKEKEGSMLQSIIASMNVTTFS